MHYDVPMTMTTARCDRTDLLVDQCSHCRGLDPEPKVKPVRLFEAKYTGWCAHCMSKMEPGDMVGYDSDHDLICEQCGS